MHNIFLCEVFNQSRCSFHRLIGYLQVYYLWCTGNVFFTKHHIACTRICTGNIHNTICLITCTVLENNFMYIIMLPVIVLFHSSFDDQVPAHGGSSDPDPWGWLRPRPVGVTEIQSRGGGRDPVPRTPHCLYICGDSHKNTFDGRTTPDYAEYNYMRSISSI